MTFMTEGRDLDRKRVKEVILNAKQYDVQVAISVELILMRNIIFIVPCFHNEEKFIFMGTSERLIMNQAPESLQTEFKNLRYICFSLSATNDLPSNSTLQDDNLKFVPTYDEALLHLVFAGSDIILCQSFLDPTDEIPLIALRYGAAPIALAPDASSNRSIPFDRSFINQDHEATKYSELINSSFVNMSISLAIDEIRTNPAMWKRKIMQAMAHDLSWDGECYDVHVEAYSAIKNM
ncbi:putative glycogen synthase 2 [Glycine soja]